MQKNYLIIFCLLLLFSCFYPEKGESHTSNYLKTETRENSSSGKWIKIPGENNNFEFYYSIEKCSNDSVLFIKVVNNTREEQKINFSILISDANHPLKSEKFTDLKVNLNAGQTLNGSCTLISPPQLFLKIRNTYSNPEVKINIQ